MRSLTGKEWNPEGWNGMFQKIDEVVDIEPLNFDEFSLPVDVTAPKETAMASLEAVVIQDNADSQDPPPSPLFASRIITRLKSIRPLKMRYKV